VGVILRNSKYSGVFKVYFVLKCKNFVYVHKKVAQLIAKSENVVVLGIKTQLFKSFFLKTYF